MTDVPDPPPPPAELTIEEQARQLISLVGRLNDSMLSSNAAIASSNTAIAASNDRIAQVAKAGSKNRRMIWTVAVSVCLDVALSVGLAVSLESAHHASNQATSAARSAVVQANANKANAVATCVSSNVVRANDVTLWTYVLSLQPSSTAAERTSRASILLFVKKTFAARAC